MQPPIPISKPDWSSLGMSFRDRLMSRQPRLSSNVQDQRGQASDLETLYSQITNRAVFDGGMSPEEAQAMLDDVRQQSTSQQDEEAWLRRIWGQIVEADKAGRSYWGQP